MDIFKDKIGRYAYMAAFLAALAAFLVYLPSLQHGFVNWDDQAYIYDNPDIRSLDLGFLKHVFTSVLVANWHPLTMLSFAVDFRLWGLNPLPYHLENIILHAINTFLVGLVTARLFNYGGAKRNAAFAGAVTALLFGLHPLHVESVSWASGRKDVLSGLFFFLSVLFYLGYKRRGSATGYIASIISFALALMSKPIAVILPFVLLVIDFYPLNTSPVKKRLLEKAPFFLLSAATALLTLWAQSSAEAIAPMEGFPLASRLLTAIWSLAFYLYKIVLPFGLAPFYPREVSPNILDYHYLAPVIVVIAITAFCVYKLKTNKLYMAAWLYYLVTLAPVIGVIQVGSQAAADRYMYLPALGPFIIVATLLCLGRGRFVKTALLIIIFVPLAFITIRQEAIWKDPVSLWSREVIVYPEEPVGYSNLGIAYKDRGDLKKALENYDKALKIDPGYADAYNNRGVAYLKAGMPSEALEDFTRALALNPQNTDALLNRATAYINLGEFGYAVRDLSRHIESSPGDPRLSRDYFNRGIAFTGLDDLDSALADYNASIALDPGFAGAYINRGGVLMKKGEYKRAIDDFNTALALNPNDAIAYYNLGVISSKLGDTDKAVYNLRKAASLGLNQAESYLREMGY